MIAAAHVAAGAVCGLLAARLTRTAGTAVALSFALGVASHVPMDAIPHSDYVGLTRPQALIVALVEVVALVALIRWTLRDRLAPPDAPCMVAGALGALLPDAKIAAEVVLPQGIAAPMIDFWERFHALHAAPPDARLLGLAAELTLTVLLLIWLARLRPPAAPGEGSSAPRAA